MRGTLRLVHREPSAALPFPYVARAACSLQCAGPAGEHRSLPEIAAASQAQLAAVARIGGAIAATTRAARMRRSGQMVLARWHGDLRGALQLPVEKARRALAAFPMIGEPGADKILAFAGAAPLVAIDSNGLRVLQRLGLAPASGDYRRDYRADDVGRRGV